MNAGVKIVPSPKPEKKVSIETKNATSGIIIISISFSKLNLELIQSVCSF
jgi:hypothetical protein